MDISRRQFAAGVVATLAGCSGVSGDADPDYPDATAETLVLPISTFPGGWERDDAWNQNFDACYLNSQRTIVVMMTAGAHESVSAAKDAMQQARQGAADPNTIDIGDDAFWHVRSSNDAAETVVRDSNALATIVASRQSGATPAPDETRSQRYARETVAHWTSL